MRDVLFIDDLVARLGISRRTIQRRRRLGVFPVPELEGLSRTRPRWSKVAVDQYLATCKPVKAGDPKRTFRLVESRAAR